jgi:hypothetical protein
MQIFHGHQAVAVDQSSGQFVLKIVALMEHLPMQFGNVSTGSAPTPRTLAATRNMALLPAQFLLRPTEPSRVFDDFSLTGDGERL